MNRLSRLISSAFALAVCIAGSGVALAQAYPAKTIRLILPFPPGGPTDITGRAIAQKLAEQIGQPLVTDNRPGAAGNIGLELAAKSPPDGYTIVLTAPPLAISPSLYVKLNCEQKDLAPISLVATIHFCRTEGTARCVGVEAVTSTPERFAEFIKNETVRYAKVIKDAGIKAR